MNKTSAIVILLCLVSIAIAAVEAESAAKHDYPAIAEANWGAFVEKLKDPDQEVRIVFLGDSITEKNFHTHEKPNYFDYATCYFLALNPHANVKNVGKSGRTTVTALEILEPEVLNFKPEYDQEKGLRDYFIWYKNEYDIDLKIS